jgi:hypothetical protein
VTERVCGNCKHWKRVVPTEPWGYGTGIPLQEETGTEYTLRTAHGHCERIIHVKAHEPGRPFVVHTRSDAELRAAPAVACDSEGYSAWVATLPTFGCVLFEEKT